MSNLLALKPRDSHFPCRFLLISQCQPYYRSSGCPFSPPYSGLDLSRQVLWITEEYHSLLKLLTILICTALTKGRPRASLLSFLFLSRMLIGLSLIFSTSFLSYPLSFLYTISCMTLFYCLAFCIYYFSLCNLSSSTALEAISFWMFTNLASSCSLALALLSISICSSCLFCYF